MRINTLNLFTLFKFQNDIDYFFSIVSLILNVLYIYPKYKTNKGGRNIKFYTIRDIKQNNRKLKNNINQFIMFFSFKKKFIMFLIITLSIKKCVITLKG